MPRCQQELCPNWSGDGDVCPCALFDIEIPRFGYCRAFEGHLEAVAATRADGLCDGCRL